MKHHHLTTLPRSLTAVTCRRQILSGLAAIGLGLTTLRQPDSAAAKNRHHKKGKSKKGKKRATPPQPPLSLNVFGCLDVGQPCRGDSTLCCSGVCDPSTLTCVAHNVGICRPDISTCIVGVNIPCHPGKETCTCAVTTGNAGFCGDFTDVVDPTQICRVCSRDTDCQEEFGPGAACVVMKGFCAASCAATGLTGCVRACI